MKLQRINKAIHDLGSMQTYSRMSRTKSDLHAEAERQAIASHSKQNIKFTPRGK